MENIWRDSLVLALDLDEKRDALSIASSLNPFFGIVKVGLQLFSNVGPEIISELKSINLKVFIDLKLFDIPNTVYSATKALAKLGVDFITVHLSGGEEMVLACKEGVRDGLIVGSAPTTVLGVTVLTSEPQATEATMTERLSIAKNTNIEGVVCASSDLKFVNNFAPNLLTLVPGIRLKGNENNDQKRVATPSEAFKSGADFIVLGRSITNSPNMIDAAKRVLENLKNG